MEIQIAALRKLRGVSQQQLAKHLGVTYQAVSKWETKASLPDITLLPEIANYFEVSTDEVLGLVPLHDAPYIPRNTDDREGWSNRQHVIKNDRAFFWNDDYLEFLVRQVWKITKPIDFIEFGCCDGDLGARLLDVLPEGSTYTGLDSEYLVGLAREKFKQLGKEGRFLVSDCYSFETENEFRNWNQEKGKADSKGLMTFMMSRGYKRSEIEDLIRYQEKMSEYLNTEQEEFGILQYFGFVISYGRK